MPSHPLNVLRLLAEKQGGKIVVGRIMEGSNAEQAPEQIKIGDQVLAVSGRELVRYTPCSNMS
jgi:C-terminal processing protease CtpA/Prc